MLTVNYRPVDHVDSDQTSIREQASNSINTTRGLPENTVYRDTGCDLASSCLECPLALCKYDDPNQGRHSRTIMRDTEIMRLFAEGFKVSAIALKVNVSNRTVYRIIQREMGIALDKSGARPKWTTRRRKLHERVPSEQLAAWSQYSMREMAEVKAA